MPDFTANYNFIKPKLSDSPPDITGTNSNWDMLDSELANLEESLSETGGFVLMDESIPVEGRSENQLYALRVRKFSE